MILTYRCTFPRIGLSVLIMVLLHTGAGQGERLRCRDPSSQMLGEPGVLPTARCPVAGAHDPPAPRAVRAHQAPACALEGGRAHVSKLAPPSVDTRARSGLPKRPPRALLLPKRPKRPVAPQDGEARPARARRQAHGRTLGGQPPQALRGHRVSGVSMISSSLWLTRQRPTTPARATALARFPRGRKVRWRGRWGCAGRPGGSY